MVGPHDERQVEVQWILVNPGVQQLVAEPLPRRVVVLVEDVSRPEDVAEVPAMLVRVEVVIFDKLPDSFGPHEVIGVVEVNLLDGDPVPGDRVGVVRDPLGNPVVTGDDFHVPDIVLVGEDDPVPFGGTVLLDQPAEVTNPILGTVDERQGGADDQVFIDPAFRVQRVAGEDPLVGVDTLRGAHADVLLVEAALVEDPFVNVVDIWRPLVAVAIGGPVNHALVQVGLYLVGVVVVGRVGDQLHWV